MSSILTARGGMVRAWAAFRVVLVAAVCICVAAESASASRCAGGMRPQDEIVLVNVRPAAAAAIRPAARRAACSSKRISQRTNRAVAVGRASDLSSVVAADPTVSTVIFVHGNRLTSWDAKCEGLAAYRRIVRQSGDEKPIRFVIFSWPSTQISGPLKDVRVKAARTRPAGCQLAWFVDQLPAETPLTMVGFSFGARIITGSLHILGGGSLGSMGARGVAASESPAGERRAARGGAEFRLALPGPLPRPGDVDGQSDGAREQLRGSGDEVLSLLVDQRPAASTRPIAVRRASTRLGRRRSSSST